MRGIKGNPYYDAIFVCGCFRDKDLDKIKSHFSLIGIGFDASSDLRTIDLKCKGCKKKYRVIYT